MRRLVLTLQQVRQRTKIVLEKAKKNQLKHFDVDIDKVRFPRGLQSFSQCFQRQISRHPPSS